MPNPSELARLDAERDESLTRDDLNRLRAALLLLEQIDFSNHQGLYDSIPFQALEEIAG